MSATPFRVPAPVPLRTNAPGCWDCPYWTRLGASVGRGPSWGGQLSSYAARCADHPSVMEGA